MIERRTNYRKMSIFGVSDDRCTNNYKDYYKYFVTCQLSKAMLWIGLYAATASLACLISLLFDIFSAFRSRRLWIPCNFFALNAASLTISAVAMKMPLDINTFMGEPVDEFTKLSSTVLMCISICFFMPSLGAMKDREIVTNLIALGILVITIIVNICIQIAAGATIGLGFEHMTVTILMFLLFILSILSALAIGTTKKDLGLRYAQFFKKEKVKKMTVPELELYVKKYWMLAESGSPQFIMARSVFSVASNSICLMAATNLAEAEIRAYQELGTPRWFLQTDSDYRWSTIPIVGIQSIAVYMGVLAIFLRWVSAVKLNLPKNGIRSYKVFKVEHYWIERLVELKASPLPLKIRGPKSKKFFELVKRVFLQFVIKVQIVTVVACKFSCLLSISVVRLFVKKHVHQPRDSNKQLPTEPVTPQEQDHARYTLRLEGEEEMDEMILKSINKEVEILIREGKRNQPKNLLELLKKSMDFNWVIKFGRNRVLSSDTEGPLPNCWSLSIVTLTSIAIATCKGRRSLAGPLVRAVSESLVYVNLVEKCLDANGNVANGIIEASKTIWLGVELFSEWLDQDLRQDGNTFVKLADVAKSKYDSIDEHLNENNSQWRNKVAASSMYKICTRLQLEDETSSELTDDEMFEKLSSMIAGTLGACLTNFSRVIAIKCHSNVIDKREESVKHAARLLGETEEILEFLNQHELFCLGNDQVASIDDWRANIARMGGIDDPVVSSSNERMEVVLET